MSTNIVTSKYGGLFLVIAPWPMNEVEAQQVVNYPLDRHNEGVRVIPIKNTDEGNAFAKVLA